MLRSGGWPTTSPALSVGSIGKPRGSSGATTGAGLGVADGGDDDVGGGAVGGTGVGVAAGPPRPQAAATAIPTTIATIARRFPTFPAFLPLLP